MLSSYSKLGFALQSVRAASEIDCGETACSDTAAFQAPVPEMQEGL